MAAAGDASKGVTSWLRMASAGHTLSAARYSAMARQSADIALATSPELMPVACAMAANCTLCSFTAVNAFMEGNKACRRTFMLPPI